MSICSNVTEQGLISLRKLAQQQSEQQATKRKNRILKQTHDIELAERFSPIKLESEKIDEFNKSTREIGEIMKKSQPSQNIKIILQNCQSQTPAIENTTGTQSLRDTLTFIKQSNNCFKLEERPDGRVYWNSVRIKPVRENTIDIIGREYDVTPSIQQYFRKAGSTGKSFFNIEKVTVYNIPKDVGLYNTRQKTGLGATRMKDALYDLPKEIAKIGILLYHRLKM